MLSFNEATLRYIGQTKASNGSPKEVAITRTMKVKEIKTFSLNYYTMGDDNQRSMRLSKNIVVPIWATDDIVEDGVRYELMYIVYNGLNYRVKEILKYYKQSKQMVLDVEEVR